MRRRGLAPVRSLIARVRVAPSAEPLSRLPIPRAPPADLPVRPRLADHASRCVQLERDVWDQFRPQVCEAVQAALDAVAVAEATRARPVCCGQAMPRHDRRRVQWLTWVGVVRAPVTRYRCAGCRAERRPLLETLEVEPGQPSGWRARQLGWLGCVASYPSGRGPISYASSGSRRDRPRPGASPADLRGGLERARLDTLPILRALDQARRAARDLSQSALAHLAALDADCAEALWTLDQPVGGLDLHAMVRDTLASLEALTDARAQVRARLPLDARARLDRLAPVIRATLDPLEAYTAVPGRDPQNR